MMELMDGDESGANKVDIRLSVFNTSRCSVDGTASSVITSLHTLPYTSEAAELC